MIILIIERKRLSPDIASTKCPLPNVANVSDNVILSMYRISNKKIQQGLLIN